MSDSDSDYYDPAVACNTNTGDSFGAELSRKTATAPQTRTEDVSTRSSLQPYVFRKTLVKEEIGKEIDAKRAVTSTECFGKRGLDNSLTSLNYFLCGIKGRARSICLNPSGSILCAGGECGTVCMWDFSVPLTSRAVKPTRSLTPFPNRISGFQPVVSVHAACDGSYFVLCQDGDCPALISASGKQLGYCAMGQRGMVDVVRCKGHRAPVMCSAPSSTVSGRFFTGSQDSTARMWDSASFDRQSVYAVKHGSGQLLENVVVETVLPITSINNDKASLFATGGEDGLVQLWDTRQNYRPGGVLGVLNMYGRKDCAKSKANVTEDNFFSEKHVGGMVEPDLSRPILCVRCGSYVRVVDLRKTGKAGDVEDVCPQLTGLPFTMETTPLVSCTSAIYSQGNPSFMTCTSREGYQHVAGGHVVQFIYIDGSFKQAMVWKPKTSVEDVLSVAVDVERGQIFAGMQSGDVVGQVKKVGVDAPVIGPTVHTWFATRPEREGRALGTKSRREETNGWDDLGEVEF